MNLQNIILSLLILVCVFTDIRRRKILNIVTLPGIILGIVLNSYFATDHISGALFGLKGMFFGFLIFIIPIALRALGAGDVKMLAMLGTFWGADKVLWTGLYSALAGGSLSFLFMAIDHSTFEPVKKYLKNFVFAFIYRTNIPSPEKKGINKRYFPYSVAILIGTLIVYFFKI
jgi:prepilin peptidase CpaA